jgi:outer membrane receptor protein involved in Fe transport
MNNFTRTTPPRLRLQPLCAALLCAWQLPAWAQDATTEPAPLVVRGHYDNAVGTSNAASQGVVNAELLKSRPAQRPGEVLEFVPGVIVTQHAGDGKANQYFLRGFNLDHGTDFATRLNGMPINLPSHAHGQGYTDLNVLLPELVQRIEYRKGPYFASSGDFATAGGADIHYKTRLDEDFGQLTLGANGYRRAVVAGSGQAGALQLLGAAELMRNDGPWTVPEALRRENAVFTASTGTAASGWQSSLMHYGARWTSTDQVPERALLSGQLGRFDSLDPTAGGDTRRSSLSASWHHQGAQGHTRVQAYALRYTLDLISNFTYALDNPVDGDQFEQQDRRHVLGLSASHTVEHRLAGLNLRSEFGLQTRVDRATVGLFKTAQRQRLDTVREDQVRLQQTGVYGQSTLELTPWLRSVLGLRADHQQARTQLLAGSGDSGRASGSRLSPKLALVAGPFQKTEFFFNAGRGFHSNDARGTTAQTDPAPALVAASGMELGLRTEALPGLQSSLALWQLRSDSELVYVGDAGVTEASLGSRRHGVEWSNRYMPRPWLLLDADLAWSHARFSNGDRIPNAIDRVASLAATVRELGPWSASLQWRYLGSGALVEDNSVRSRPAITTNLRVGHRFSRRLEASLDVFNLFDRPVEDIQYFYESQLRNESAPVSDRHLHPAEPRSLRLTVKLAL